MPLRAHVSGIALVCTLVCTTRMAEAQNFSQLVDRGIALQEAGRARDAIAAYEAALRIGNPGDVNYEIASANLGQVYCAIGQLDRAEATLSAVLAKRQARLDPNHEMIGKVLGDLGAVYHQQGKMAEAIRAREREVEIYRRHFNIEEPRMLRAAESLANLYMEVAIGGKAEELTRDTIARLENRVGPNDGRLQSSLLNLAQLEVQQGHYRQADQLIERARRLPALPESKATGPEIEGTLAMLYQSMGRYAEALEQQRAFERALPPSLLERPEGKGLIFSGWAAQGELLLDLGQVDEAVRLLAAAQNGREAMRLPNPPSTLQNLARGYQRLGQLDKAEASYRRVMASKTSFVGNRVYCGVLLASLLMSQGKSVEPEQLLLAGLEHCEKFQMLETAFCATIHRLLGELYLLKDRLREGETQFRAAQAILEQDEGQHFADVAANWLGLAEVYDAQHKTLEALAAADAARRKLHDVTVTALPLLAESQQLMFLANEDGPGMQRALTLARAHAADQRAVDLSAAWMLNRKGVAQQVLAERLLLSREVQDPALAALVDDWVAVRHQLAQLATASEGGGRGRQEMIADLNKREQELAQQLGRAKVRLAEPKTWQELADFRRAIPQSSIYVDLLRFAPAKGGKPVYLVWLVPPAGEREIKLLELGSAAEVDAAIEALRKQLDEIPGQLRPKRGLALIDQPAAENKEQFRRSLEQLGQQLLAPLLPTLSKYEHWIICPDAAPWLVPWSALPLAAEDSRRPKYVVEKHRVTFTTSGRDLLEKQTPVSGNPALVLADPDFEHTPDNSTPPAVPAQQPWFAEALATRSAQRATGHWTALPGTAEESRLLLPALNQYTRREPQLLLHAQASKAAFKAAWRPRVAVFSTHGFFLNATSGGAQSQNPMARCGLVFAGANSSSARSSQAQDDGIITGLDVLETDLRGTELVVLSACETAVGQLSASEGVAGLRQAFQLSGARSVAATLWRIPDEETARLMKLFFDRLAAGADKATALQQAQQALLAAHGKDAADTSHPYFWAAFTLTGDWRTPQVGPAVPRPERRPARVQVEVVTETARLMEGSAVVKTVIRGDRLTRGKTDGEWIEVFYEPGTTKTAHIHRSKVRDVK